MQDYYDKKIIISGQYIELYFYHQPIYDAIEKNFQEKEKKSNVREFREDNLVRTRTSVIRLINSNPDMDKFLTLTYSYKMHDLDKSNLQFKNFILRLRRKYNQFKYFAVPEFQLKTTNNVHYHMLSNLPYISTYSIQNTFWREGICFVEKVNNVSNLGLYMSKYLNKDFHNERYYQKKKYLASGNLTKPTVLKGQEVENYLLFFDKLINISFKTTFESSYVGTIDYYSGYLSTF